MLDVSCGRLSMVCPGYSSIQNGDSPYPLEPIQLPDRFYLHQQ